ncbi:hypothetical protein HPP92_005489 [Vanilla planifolia]|uniref:Uncharacterized protein n=1 Tax=Vanilla planifolia TaxID=51239 RepID=A0A835RNN3_VANPL|nr:hypothetical protein HPP92_005489 [Vanilla planifolia]
MRVAFLFPAFSGAFSFTVFVTGVLALSLLSSGQESKPISAQMTDWDSTFISSVNPVCTAFGDNRRMQGSRLRCLRRLFKNQRKQLEAARWPFGQRAELSIGSFARVARDGFR